MFLCISILYFSRERCDFQLVIMGVAANPFFAISNLFVCGLFLLFSPCGEALKLRLKLGFADGMLVGCSLNICSFFYSRELCG